MTGKRPAGRPRRSAELLTPPQVRMVREDWADYVAVHGSDAAERVRRFVAWDLRRPGARLPARPARQGS